MIHELGEHVALNAQPLPVLHPQHHRVHVREREVLDLRFQPVDRVVASSGVHLQRPEAHVRPVDDLAERKIAARRCAAEGLTERVEGIQHAGLAPRGDRDPRGGHVDRVSLRRECVGVLRGRIRNRDLAESDEHPVRGEIRLVSAHQRHLGSHTQLPEVGCAEIGLIGDRVGVPRRHDHPFHGARPTPARRLEALHRGDGDRESVVAGRGDAPAGGLRLRRARGADLGDGEVVAVCRRRVSSHEAERVELGRARSCRDGGGVAAPGGSAIGRGDPGRILPTAVAHSQPPVVRGVLGIEDPPTDPRSLQRHLERVHGVRLHSGDGLVDHAPIHPGAAGREVAADRDLSRGIRVRQTDPRRVAGAVGSRLHDRRVVVLSLRAPLARLEAAVDDDGAVISAAGQHGAEGARCRHRHCQSEPGRPGSRPCPHFLVLLPPTASLRPTRLTLPG